MKTIKMHPASITFCFLILAAAAIGASDTNQSLLEEALVKAAAKGNSSEVRRLLDVGVNVNSRHPLTAWSALTAAAYHGQLEIVRVLIQAGANVNARDKTGGTPLLKAVTLGHADDVSKLLTRKAQIVRELLKAGADPQLRDSLGGTAWEMAMINDHQELVQAFEGVKGIKETQMIEAAAAGDVSLVKKMLEGGVDVNYKDSDGWSALSEASLGGDVEILKVLLSFKVDVNLKHQKGWTALMIAAQNNREEVVRSLLKAGADPKTRSDDGSTATMIALKQGNTAIAELLK